MYASLAPAPILVYLLASVSIHSCHKSFLVYGRTWTMLLMCISTHTVLTQVLPFRVYTVEQGLISDAVTSLCQDSKGYLWIGTGEGISVFDGKSVRNISMTDGLALNSVSHIAESRSTPGTMLIGTWGGGVTRLSKGTFTTLLPDSADAARTIINVQEDHTGTIWCATESGVYRFTHGERFQVQKSEDAYRLLIARDNRVWIASSGHVLVCAPGTGEILSRIDIPGASKPTAMHEDRKGGIWIATADGRIIRLAGKEVVLQRAFTEGVVGSIADDVDGSIWLGTDNGLFLIRSPLNPVSAAVRYSVENGLRSNKISACLLDHEENLWIGNSDVGLQELSERSVHSFPVDGIPESYNNNKAVTDDAGHVWIITFQGLWEMWRDEAGNWRTRLNGLQISSNESMPTIARDSRNRLWIDTGRRIECYTLHRKSDGSTRLTLVASLEPGIQLPDFLRFFFTLDSKENLWISVLERGVYKLNVSASPPVMKHLTQRDGLPSNDIRAMYEDRQGRMWLGSFAEGVAVVPIDGDTIVEHITSAEGLSENRIRGFVEDHQGRIWIGTRRNGINIIDGATVKRISVQDGLPGATVWALTADNERQLIWAGTVQGVHRIDMATGRPLGAISSLLVKPVTSLGTYRGQFLWFVTKDALTIYQYSAEDTRESKPRVHIKGMTVNGESREIGSTLEFRHDENHATFEFVGITFRQPEALRYQSRLLGSEDDWQLPTMERSVTYAALSPGSYTFQVRAVRGDRVLDSDPAVLSFVIVPPYWTRWWFIGLLLLALSSVIALMVRMRIRKLLEMERLRSHIARDLHDEIGSNLSSIAMASELLGRQTGLGDKEREKLSGISSVALSTVKDMKDIVWLIKPGNDSLDDLLLRMKDTAAMVLDGCRYTLNFPYIPLRRKVNLEWRQNLYLIYKETLTNIIRHARATVVDIQVRLEGDRLILHVKDDGDGFDPMSVKGGNGLRNIRDRAGMLKADLSIRSGPGRGTAVDLAVRIT